MLCALSVIIHIVSKCHEEGLEHYLRSFVKVSCRKHCQPVSVSACVYKLKCFCFTVLSVLRSTCL